MNRRRYDEHWHLDKTLNVGHMVTTVIALVAAFMYFMGVDKRVDANTQAIGYLKEEKLSIEQTMARQRNEMIDQMKGIDSKLDRIIERQTERRDR